MHFLSTPRLAKLLVIALLSHQVIAGSQNPFGPPDPEPEPEPAPPATGGSQNPSGGGSGTGTTDAAPPAAGGGGQNPFGGGGGSSNGAAPATGGGSQNPTSGGSGSNSGVQVNKASYNCPDDNGLKYATQGITFELKCKAGTAAKPLRSTTSTSLIDCADQCAADKACMSCDWSPNSCNLKAEYIPTFEAPYQTWFPTIDRSKGYCPVVREKEQNLSAGVIINPTCPEGDGQLWTGSDGTSFYLQCCTHPVCEKVVGMTRASDLKGCMEACIGIDACRSIKYETRPFLSGSAPPEDLNCMMCSGDEFSTGVCDGGSPNANHDSAFVGPPPTQEQEDAVTIKCSTECPYANGQQFSSKTGEAFHIDCGLRHGTAYIYVDEQPTLKDCMNACGSLLPCHSVDYERRTKTCFYSNHHGEPAILASGFDSAHTVGCTGGCGECDKCGGN